MTSANCSDFFTPPPFVEYTNQLILFLSSAFWGPPSASPHPLDVIYGSPLTSTCNHGGLSAFIAFLQFSWHSDALLRNSWLSAYGWSIIKYGWAVASYVRLSLVFHSLPQKCHLGITVSDLTCNVRGFPDIFFSRSFSASIVFSCSFYFHPIKSWHPLLSKRWSLCGTIWRRIAGVVLDQQVFPTAFWKLINILSFFFLIRWDLFPLRNGSQTYLISWSQLINKCLFS